MHFYKLSAVALSIASFTSASMYSHCSSYDSCLTYPGPIAHDSALAARDATPVAKGLVWTPRSLQTRQFGEFGFGNDKKNKKFNKNKNNNIIIAQPINIELTQIQIVQEVQIINVVQNLIIIDGADFFKDNIRKNHFKNVNKNRQVVSTCPLLTADFLRDRY